MEFGIVCPSTKAWEKEPNQIHYPRSSRNRMQCNMLRPD